MASRATRLHLRGGNYQKCLSRKHCYPTRADALDAAEAMMHAGAVLPGCHITPYRCDDCGTWHVTNRQIVSVR